MRVTALYAGLLGGLFFWLSARIIVLRRAYRVDMGSGASRLLERFVRAHGNFAEYVPIGLVLLLVAESGGWAPAVLHAPGLALLAGRVVHAYSFSGEEPRPRSRVAGAALTLTALAVLAALCLWQALDA